MRRSSGCLHAVGEGLMWQLWGPRSFWLLVISLLHLHGSCTAALLLDALPALQCMLLMPQLKALS